MTNSNLHKAKEAQNNEFYTQIADIEKELYHYREHFKDKHVFLNCDDPEHSNFWKYFELNFQFLGLKKLTAIHFKYDKPSYKLEMHKDVNGIVKTPLKQNGDFRSSESLDVLVQCDIVVTNPPFSLFREYMKVLLNSGKQFLVIGPISAITYKGLFKHIREYKLWLGNNYVKDFKRPDGEMQKFGNILWYTNIEHNKRNEELILVKKYLSKECPTYDNYNAININKVVDIPIGYTGAMGVPITYLTKHNPNQFEILDGIGRYSMIDGPTKETQGTYLTKVDGKPKYARIIIKAKGNK